MHNFGRTTLKESFKTINTGDETTDLTHELFIVGKPKKIGYSTFEYQRVDGSRIIRYHHTDIIVIYPDSSFRLFDGGWKTVTTKRKMNEFMPSGWSVSSDKGIWYVRKAYNFTEKVPYFNGMKLPDDYKPEVHSKLVEEQKILRKKINAFVKATIKNGTPLPQPNRGDCWYCRMHDKSGVTLGNSTNDDHLLSHIEEHYMHGSLIVNAMRWAGYRNARISLHYHMRPDSHDDVRRTVRRYLGCKLGLAV